MKLGLAECDMVKAKTLNLGSLIVCNPKFNGYQAPHGQGGTLGQVYPTLPELVIQVCFYEFF